MTEKQNIKNILIIKLSSIGDCLLATPAIESIRKAYPKSSITWLIEDKAKDIALLNPYIDETIIIDKKNYKLKDYLKLIALLKSRRYDLSLDLQGVDRTSLFAFLSGAKERYVEEYANLGFLSNKKISRAGRKFEHAAKFYLYLAKSSGGLVPDDIKLTFKTNKTDKEFADKFISENFYFNADTAFIGINPGGTWATKKWPAKYFAKLSELILRKYNARIVIFGGKEDKTYAEQIINALQNNYNNAKIFNSEEVFNKEKSENINTNINKTFIDSKISIRHSINTNNINTGNKSGNKFIADTTGKTTLMQAKELISKMDYFITGDSGLMHIAASIENGPEIIALFGPTSSELTGPIVSNVKILQGNLICSPCFKKSCGLINKKEINKYSNDNLSPDSYKNINNYSNINYNSDNNSNNLDENAEIEKYALCMKKICVSDVFKLISGKPKS
ncbi:MAG: glycosyltransferase family 9 protein [bacterium]